MRLSDPGAWLDPPWNAEAVGRGICCVDVACGVGVVVPNTGKLGPDMDFTLLNVLLRPISLSCNSLSRSISIGRELEPADLFTVIPGLEAAAAGVLAGLDPNKFLKNPVFPDCVDAAGGVGVDVPEPGSGDLRALDLLIRRSKPKSPVSISNALVGVADLVTSGVDGLNGVGGIAAVFFDAEPISMVSRSNASRSKSKSLDIVRTGFRVYFVYYYV